MKPVGLFYLFPQSHPFNVLSWTFLFRIIQSAVQYFINRYILPTSLIDEIIVKTSITTCTDKSCSTDVFIRPNYSLYSLNNATVFKTFTWKQRSAHRNFLTLKSNTLLLESKWNTWFAHFVQNRLIINISRLAINQWNIWKEFNIRRSQVVLQLSTPQN